MPEVSRKRKLGDVDEQSSSELKRKSSKSRDGTDEVIASTHTGSVECSENMAPSSSSPHGSILRSNSVDKKAEQAAADKATLKARPRINKLSPPRPFSTVSPSVNATGPRSAHHEGKNYIAITRKTELSAYIRRCKDIVLRYGYKSLHLSALGAAIPHLMTLAVSIPAILPFPADEIRTEILTGTVEVQDEILPDDEDEDISYGTRSKSSLSIIITIGDGIDEKIEGGAKWGPRGKRKLRSLSVDTTRKNKASSREMVHTTGKTNSATRSKST